MRILMTGGTGLIGRALCARLLQLGHELTVLSRRPAQVHALCGAAVHNMQDLREYTPEREFDAVINLAGESIAGQRWTHTRKNILRRSRIHLTEYLMMQISQVKSCPRVILSGSAIGFYGDQGDAWLDEKIVAGADFGAQLCVDWEASALAAASFGMRVCLLRTGLVLAREGGMLGKLRLPFLLGLGARLGNGRQWMSWIHIADYVDMLVHLLSDERAHGSFNLVAPEPVTNAEFTQTLAKSLHRPAFLVAPAWVLKLVLGEMSELLLGGQRVRPAKLSALGYSWRYPGLALALQEIYSR